MEIQENVSLAPLTTLKIGGPARFFVRVTEEQQIRSALEFAREHRLGMYVLGGGSNVVVPDAGFPGLVLQVAIQGEVSPSHQGDMTRGRFEVPAGADWDEFVKLTCREGYSGVECLAGIPGTVGGSPVQNIGAYGQDVSETIRAVRAFDRERLGFVDLRADECGFGYRRSIFNTTHRERYIVTQVTFELAPDAAPKLRYAELQTRFEGKPEPRPMEVYDAVREIRSGKGMLIDAEQPSPDSRSAGSFFKNPVVLPAVAEKIAAGLGSSLDEVPHWMVAAGVKLSAAWMIEQAGFRKGFALGRVGISSRHTLALINRTGDASCDELMRLRDLIVMTVEDRFRVSLEQEPVVLA